MWGLIPGSGRSQGGRNGNPLFYSFLPGKFHGQRSLVGYSPWGLKELYMIACTHTHTHTHTHSTGTFVVMNGPILIHYYLLTSRLESDSLSFYLMSFFRSRIPSRIAH